MAQIFQPKTSLLTLVGLLLVITASVSAKHLPKPAASNCELLDREPPSNPQVISFGNSSSLTFDGSIRITRPGKPDQFVALENGSVQGSTIDPGDVAVGIQFNCSLVGLQSSDYVAMGYIAWTGKRNPVSLCHEAEQLHLGPDGSYTSPNGKSTDFKCLNVEGKASALALRYLKIEVEALKMA